MLVHVENIWGPRCDDIIRGDDGVGGQIYGFEGNDILEGRGGDDVFYGGTGADVMTGGAGAEDVFYLSYNDHRNQHGTLEAYEGGDTISDFEHGVDHIAVSRYWFGCGNVGGPAGVLTDQYADFATPGYHGRFVQANLLPERSHWSAAVRPRWQRRQRSSEHRHLDQSAHVHAVGHLDGLIVPAQSLAPLFVVAGTVSRRW